MHNKDAVFLEDLCPKLGDRRWRKSIHNFTATNLNIFIIEQESERDDYDDLPNILNLTDIYVSASKSDAGIAASGDNEALCNDQGVRDWLLEHLKTNNMTAPKWKGYEIARHLILDPNEWTTDNDMLTPSMKVKLRNLLAKHKDEIDNISS